VRRTKLVCIIADKNVVYQKFYLFKGKIKIIIKFLFSLAGNTVGMELILATLQLENTWILGVKICFFPAGT